MKIRNYQPKDFEFLKQMLQIAIYEPITPAALAQPEFQIYYENFGQGVYDYGQVMTVNTGRPIGIIWCRLIKGYGYVQADLPELAMAISPQFQHRGYGTQLLASFLELAQQHNFTGLSLSVARANEVAVHLYENANFEVVQNLEHSLVMKLVF